MQRQTHAGLLRLWNDGLEEVGDVGPHLVERVGSLLGQGGQVLHSLVVEAGPTGASPASFFEVAFHGAVRVPVVFDDR